MTAYLHPSWRLTDEHASGLPVLLHSATGDAYGPDDIIRPYPSWGYMPCRQAVCRMAKVRPLSVQDLALVDIFCGRESLGRPST